jgi:hypothetical protein
MIVVTGREMRDFSNFNPSGITIVGQNGQNFPTLSQFHGTVYQDIDTGQTYATLTFIVVSDGWAANTAQINPPPGGGLYTVQDLKDSQYGLLVGINCAKDNVLCGGQPPYQSGPALVAPNVYDPCEAMTLYWPGGYVYYKC